MIDLRSQGGFFNMIANGVQGKICTKFCLKWKGRGNRPRYEQIIQYCKIPILGMVPKTWKNIVQQAHFYRTSPETTANYFQAKICIS